MHGLSIEAWIRLWSTCHAMTFGGITRLCWPDGLSTLEQPAIVVDMFERITVQMSKEAMRKRDGK